MGISVKAVTEIVLIEDTNVRAKKVTNKLKFVLAILHQTIHSVFQIVILIVWKASFS